MYSKSSFNKLSIEIKCKCSKNLCRQNKCYQKCALFPAPSSQWFISHQLHHHESYIRWSTRFLCLNLDVRFCIFNSVSFFFRLLFWFNKKQAVFQISVKIKTIEKPHTTFCSQTFGLGVATRSFKLQWYLLELELPKKWPGDELRKSTFWERQFFSIVSFK